MKALKLFKGLAAAAVAVAISASMASAATELVSNGGFETGNFSGWTQSGNTGFTGVSTGAPHSGAYDAYMGPVGSDGYLTQTLATTAGHYYDISFYLRNDYTGPNDFSASFGGSLLTSLVNSSSFGYTLYSFTHVLATGADALAFSFRQDPSYWHLDDVSVVASVPVPAAGILLMGALGGLAALRRRKTLA